MILLPCAELVVEGELGTLIRPSKAAVNRRTLQAAPPQALFSIVGSAMITVTLRNLVFEGNEEAPAVEVRGGGHALIENCQFRSNAGTAIVVRRGGDARVSSSHFIRNGRRASLHGGAVKVDGGRVQVIDSTFVRNAGLKGGALFATDSSIVSIMDSFFFKNVANDAGGVRAADGSKMCTCGRCCTLLLPRMRC